MRYKSKEEIMSANLADWEKEVILENFEFEQNLSELGELVFKKTKTNETDNDEFLTLKAYVEISSYRLKTLKAIGYESKRPTQIAKECDIIPNHISKVLRELKEHNLAVCINPEMRKGRLYKLTPLGRTLLEEL